MNTSISTTNTSNKSKNFKFFNDLAVLVEKKYNLEMHSQPIIELNEKEERVMQELLLRTTELDDNDDKIMPEDLVATIRERGVSTNLLYFLLKNAYETYITSKVPSTINLEVSDVIGEDFLDSVDAFYEHYKDSINAKNVINNKDCVIVFEILENEKLSEDKQERERFFSNLRALKEKGFKIAIDDFGGRDKNGNILHSNTERVKEFILKGVLDIVKIDLETTKEICLCKSEKVIKIYSGILKDIINKGVQILAEGIEEENSIQKDGEKKEVDATEFMKYLKKVFGVTLFQGYGLGMPEKVENKSEVLKVVNNTAKNAAEAF